MNIDTTYKLISCGVSDLDGCLTSHVETSSLRDEIHIPANGKTKICIIRRLSDSKFLVCCRWCGKFFETYRSKILTGRGRYCSKKCLGYANGAQRILDKKGVFSTNRCAGKLNVNWQGGDFRDCVICGYPFWLYPSRRQETCSIECGYERAKLVRNGKLYSLNHKRKYGGCSEWFIIRHHILERDNYTCQKCFVYLPNSTGFLHIHHRIRLNDGGSNLDSNLITYCKDCHSKIHKFDRIR